VKEKLLEVEAKLKHKFNHISKLENSLDTIIGAKKGHNASANTPDIMATQT